MARSCERRSAAPAVSGPPGGWTASRSWSRAPATVRFQRLVAQEASVEVSGAGSVHVTATDSLTASVSGIGDVVYSGHPESVDKDVSGLGEVRPR